MKNILLKLEVWWAKKFGKQYTNLEDLFKDLNLTDYETHSHRHCPPKNSPCGIEGEHRCCLCMEETRKQKIQRGAKEFATNPEWQKVMKDLANN